MAEFCPECLEKLDGKKYSESEYVISKDLDLCEGCGEWKRIVVVRRSIHNGCLWAILSLFLPLKP